MWVFGLGGPKENANACRHTPAARRRAAAGVTICMMRYGTIGHSSRQPAFAPAFAPFGPGESGESGASARQARSMSRAPIASGRA